VTDLTERIHRDFVYRPGVTTVLTPVSEVMARRRGVCQDFAHLEIACLRSIGLPARYVSGHVETGGGGDGGDGLVGTGASHAWCAVALPDGTWLDLDPTNRLVAPPAHVTLAWGRDYSDVAPLKGIVFTRGGHRLSVTVRVTRVPDG
jgi:transglutaminase-like putative cysteine protease